METMDNALVLGQKNRVDVLRILLIAKRQAADNTAFSFSMLFSLTGSMMERNLLHYYFFALNHFSQLECYTHIFLNWHKQTNTI